MPDKEMKTFTVTTSPWLSSAEFALSINDASGSNFTVRTMKKGDAYALFQQLREYFE